MAWLLSQESPLTEVLRGVQRHFARGGAVGPAVFVVLILSAVVLVVYLLTRSSRPRSKTADRSNPQQVFRNLLARLELPPPRRKNLLAIAKDQALTHPSVILLSRALFDHHSAAWLNKREGRASSKGASSDLESIAVIRSILFPST